MYFVNQIYLWAFVNFCVCICECLCAFAVIETDLTPSKLAAESDELKLTFGAVVVKLHGSYRFTNVNKLTAVHLCVNQEVFKL